ncbi:hypothetical protein BKA67DRAFT_594096 [Truncatella angustata]|uniref:Uncharacterized protein n=1 Tax=Truncatella angustata TaxID=152316 RepID=A0A9P8UEQ1_9PEZI|nr:uncharacterized protein BKA67DRAFT_594096 [Truncatella angustata]KAH6648566.1 hypothetical protein BKA67DRAFT_594096 [Truncatella angustata]
MGSRPNFIDLRSTSSASVATNGSRPLRSPRLIAGEVPPGLSPLDAFAAQSRLLARQLQDSQKDGRRMSRLPPLTTESPLVVQGRSEYFRSLSYDSSEGQEGSPQEDKGFGMTTSVEEPIDRPVSMHPRMSRIPPTPDQNEPLPSHLFAQKFAERGRQLGRLEETDSNGPYGFRREQSPSDLEGLTERVTERRSMDEDANSRDASFNDTTPVSASLPPSPEKLSRQVSHDSGLAPPRTLFPKRSSSIMSQPEEYHHNDNLSGSSFGMTGLSSPAIANFHPYQRPSFNFSRPMSRAGTPGLETPQRQASSDSQPSFILADDTAHTPISMHSEAFTDDDPKAAPSYIHSKYYLPRGKALQRNSLIFNPDDISKFTNEQSLAPTINAQPFVKGQAPPSPPSRPASSSSRNLDGPPPPVDSFLARPSLERSKLSNEMSVTGEPSPRPSIADSRPSEDVPRGRPMTSPLHDQARGSTPTTVSTNDSASTIKPAKSIASTAAETSAEEHLMKGIKCHEEGSVKESTYHFRLAAKGGNSTGMLMYALACRHGWGMRPNQKEGVEWLRKAADGASLEIAEDEDMVKGGKSVDPTERKTRKAQFALSIYELGVSHMNGWGIEQDKALALRCFEIAGNWGDVDALAEAGFCYAQGIGCKKDLKKSAKFYRAAEAKGMTMPGNSWIHKPKYADDAVSIKSKKARSKSRSRGIFRRRETKVDE